MAVHRFDGAEQLFTRAVDFGYSFSVDETYDKWGRDAIIGDYFHQIRASRPVVVVGFFWVGTGGGLHRIEASTRLTAEAFRAAAGRPGRYPEQIAKAGLRPWRNLEEVLLHRCVWRPGRERARRHAGQQRCVRRGARPHLRRAGRRGADDAQVPGHIAVALTARAIRQRALVSSAGFHAAPAECEGSLDARGHRFDPGRPCRLRWPAATGRADCRAAHDRAGCGQRRSRSFTPGAWAGPSRASRPGCTAMRGLRAGPHCDGDSDAAGRFEIDFRLAQKERQFQDQRS